MSCPIFPRRLLLAAGLLTMLVACSDRRRENLEGIAPDEPPTVVMAKTLIAGELYDPEGAQWRGVRVTAAGVVCGEVNAKNLMGGYTGFKKFYFDPTAYRPNTPLVIQENWSMQTGEESTDRYVARGFEKVCTN